MSSRRQAKVNSLIHQEVAAYLAGGRFEELIGFVTITQVDTSPDLEHAKVFFSSVGQDGNEVQQILKRHVYEIQGVLLRDLKMKITPRIDFVLDTSAEHAQRISTLIHKLKKSDDA